MHDDELRYQAALWASERSSEAIRAEVRRIEGKAGLTWKDEVRLEVLRQVLLDRARDILSAGPVRRGVECGR